MNRLVRQLLFMFGPLVLRQVTKMWRNKDKQKGWNTPDRNAQNSQSQRSRKIEPEVIKAEPKLSEEEKNFRLEEDDIMLEEQDLKHINKKYDQEMDDLIERS